MELKFFTLSVLISSSLLQAGFLNTICNMPAQATLKLNVLDTINL